jgi:hypothetical protein
MEYFFRIEKMLKISKNIVLDENQKPIAVQIPIDEFERLEEIIENYGLAKMMDEVRDDERLSFKEAKNYYQSLK